MTWEVHQGDVLERLREMPDGSVQCVVTSPPYWGLRDYGVPGMIGLEPTLQEHLAKLVEVFAEVRRVLRDDGTLWLNYGDAYASGGSKAGAVSNTAHDGGVWKGEGFKDGFRNSPKCQGQGSPDTSHGTGLAAKQRLLMPARVALALQDSGWWVRSEIVWAKGLSFCPTYSGSCMPSSVRDRPTDSHEMLYLLTKRARYFYDSDAVREPAHAPNSNGSPAHNSGSQGGYEASRQDRRDEGLRPSEGTTRNLRTVWTINPQAYSEAHFATFPERLVEPCIKAGTSERGACSECGAPWRRRVEASGGSIGQAWHDHGDDLGVGAGQKGDRSTGDYSRTTTGWKPTCEHPGAPTVPCVVFDPFSGSGTTGAVAVRHGRSYIGIELNPEYAQMSLKRIGRAAADVGIGGDLTADQDEKASQRGLFA